MSKPITLINLRTYSLNDYFYIGRPGKGQTSILGNPFQMNKHSREEAIALYRKYLWYNHIKPWLETGNPSDVVGELLAMAEMNKDNEIKLGCFCHPQPCHGEVIASAIRFLQRPWVFVTGLQRPWVSVTGRDSFSEELHKHINYAMKNNCVLFLDESYGGEVIQRISIFLDKAEYPHFFLCTTKSMKWKKALKVSHGISDFCQHQMLVLEDGKVEVSRINPF